MLENQNIQENLYEILSVDTQATKDEIKAAYRRLVRKFHPDINQEVGAEEKFKKINIATETLLDDVERLKYDSSIGLSVRQERVYSKKSEQEFFQEKQKPHNKEGVFKKAFYDFFEEKHKNNNLHQEEKVEKVDGEDIFTSIVISPQDAQTGSTKKINIIHAESCPKCFGRKFINGARCTLCEGLGERSVHKKLSVKIPPNVKNGTKIRIANEGKTGKNGGKNGNLFLTVTIGKMNHVFQTEGDETICNVPISPWEAVLGANIQVPTPDGSIVMKVPPSTLSRQRFKLVGNGVKNTKTGQKGDLIVIVCIETPKNLTPQELELYEKLKILDTRNIRKELFEKGIS